RIAIAFAHETLAAHPFAGIDQREIRSGRRAPGIDAPDAIRRTIVPVTGHATTPRPAQSLKSGPPSTFLLASKIKAKKRGTVSMQSPVAGQTRCVNKSVPAGCEWLKRLRFGPKVLPTGEIKIGSFVG